MRNSTSTRVIVSRFVTRTLHGRRHLRSATNARNFPTLPMMTYARLRAGRVLSSCQLPHGRDRLGDDTMARRARGGAIAWPRTGSSARRPGRRLPSSPLGSSAVGSSERSLLTNAIVGRQAAFAEPGAEFGEKRHASECTTASAWAVLGAEARPLRLARRANRICAGSLREPCAAAKLGLLATACAPNWFLGSRPACLVVRALR